MDGVDLVEAAKEFGTPLYVTSERALRANARRFISAFAAGYPRTQVNYAVKANSNPAVISALRQEGCGADVSSQGELAIALLSRVPHGKVIFSPNNVPIGELAYALHAGVTINFDDLEPFVKLSRLGVPDTVSFRFNPGFGEGEFPGTVTGGSGSKFGVPGAELLRCYSAALNTGARKFGIHIMTGSNVLKPEHFTRVATAVLDAAAQISSKLKIGFEFVDVGGGFGVPYGRAEEPLPIESVGREVTRLFRSSCAESGLGEPLLVAEPGRYLVADTTVLLGTVNHVKTYGETTVGTDVGMNTLIRPALYGASHDVLLANRAEEEADVRAKLVGEICENTDVIAKSALIPHPVAGDIVAIMKTGAYGYAMTSQYNGRPRPAEAMVCEDGSVELIRRREDVSDLVAGVHIPPHLASD